MGATHFSGPVIAGDLQQGETNGPNQGNVILSQSTSITQNSTTAVSSTLYIPAGSRIIGFNVDVLTAFNSATSANLTIGLAAAGTDYAGGAVGGANAINAKTAGRASITFTAAQLAAMNGVTVLGVAAPTTAPVVVTVTPSGATSAGYVVVTMLYVQQ
jgi:hypothetical protein